MPTLKIDNHEIEVLAGTKVIDAAERLGINIPRFCFHPALGSVGACRVCGVSFQEGPIKGIQMSCMVNAMDGMVVSTTDAEAVDFRKHVIEWLMLNHPHDCPVCDEGGHCLLQDMTVAGGHGLRRYRGAKRTHRDQYLGPLVQHEMNRCIQCYRCTRYYQQYTGYRDLGVMGIGARVYFGRSKPGNLESPFAGNLIDICPTGVYTDKPSRFFGRRWDFQRTPSVCLHCSLGCNLVASARYRQVVRHEARPNLDVNGHFLCDRGRYGYAYTNAEDRPRQATVKGEPNPVAEALAIAGRRLEEISAQHGPASVAVIGSTRSSLESLVALNTLCRKKSWTGPAFRMENHQAVNLKAAVTHLNADLAVSLGAVSVADTIVVIGADPINEAPILALSLRQAHQKGAHITVIDPRPIDLPLAFAHWPTHPHHLGMVIRRLIGAVGEKRSISAVGSDRTAGAREPHPPDAVIRSLADKLTQSRRVVVVCGTDITEQADIDLAAELTVALRQTDTEAKLFFLLDGPNAFAAGLLMDMPLSLERILDGIEAGQIRALMVVENDIWSDFSCRQRLNRALDKLELLIIADHISSPVSQRAGVFLPTQSIYEAHGRWINQEGRLQFSRPVLTGGEPIVLTGRGDHPPRIFEKEIPGGSPHAAWRLAVRLTGTEDGGEGFNEDVFLAAALKRVDPSWGERQSGRINLKAPADAMAFSGREPGSHGEAKSENAVILLAVDQVFGTESLSSHAPALAEVTPPAFALMHTQTAMDLGLELNSDVVITTQWGRLTLAFRTDDRMSVGVIVMPRHFKLDWQVLGGTRIILDRSQVSAFADGSGPDSKESGNR